MKDVLAINKSNKQIAIWWGHTPYFIPAKTAVAVPGDLRSLCEGHEDYKDIEFKDFEGQSPEEAEMSATIELNDGEVPSKPAPERTTESDADTDPDWNPLECDYEEVEAYIERHNLVIDPDADETKVRELVDEHMQG